MKFPTQALEDGKVTKLNELMQEAQVKNYLANNPDFLHKNPQLLTHMELNHGDENTPSLVERQIKVLRERNQVLQRQLIDMLHAACNNENLLVQSNQFMLELLQTDGLESLCNKVISSLKQDFSLDGVALVLVGNYPPTDRVKVLSRAEEIKAMLNCQFPDSQPLCGRLEEQPKKALFGELCKELQSFVLVPLGEQCEYGLLALASQDPLRFDPSMGTLFVELIAKLITHLTRSYESN